MDCVGVRQESLLWSGHDPWIIDRLFFCFGEQKRCEQTQANNTQGQTKQYLKHTPGEHKKRLQARAANKHGRTNSCADHLVLGVLFLTIYSTIFLFRLSLAVWPPYGMVLSAGRAPDGMVSSVVLSPYMV